MDGSSMLTGGTVSGIPLLKGVGPDTGALTGGMPLVIPPGIPLLTGGITLGSMPGIPLAKPPCIPPDIPELTGGICCMKN